MSSPSPRRILITSALPYINGVKHLGNLAGSMLPADVYARFMRMKGEEVLYICATDEHGTPAELAAHEDGLSPADYCAKLYEIQKAQYDRLDLSFDYFGRSSCPQNHELTQLLAHHLEQNGLIEERASKQVYSVDDGRFLPDRYVEGECPHCGFERARGDQCDSCGRLLDPVDLKNPRSRISGSTNVEIRETSHLFLRQSQMQEKIRAWVEAATDWPPLARSIAFKWLDEGLQDRAITRDLSWGVPVAYQGKVRPGFENKVFYVWFDAPIAYIAATKQWSDAGHGDWEAWWRRDKGAEDVTYVEFMGKDNVAFHAVSFPVTLIGSGEPWKLVDKLKAMNWVNWYGSKFSTSEQRGIFLDDALEILPPDAWRWHLTANAPESSDFSFTLEGLQTSVNADLANVLGNFVNRVAKFCASRFDGQVPEGGALTALETDCRDRVAELIAEIDRELEAMNFRKASAAMRALWVAGNEYMQASEPWKAMKTDPVRAGVAVRFALNLARVSALVGAPVIPSATAKILAALGETGTPAWPDPSDAAFLDALPTGQTITAPEILFRQIEDAEVETWRERFSAG
ncbi:MAG: methionine--tRNA ligase [Thalassobaculaceae bacterium]